MKFRIKCMKEKRSDLLFPALGVPTGVTAVWAEDSEPGLARLLYLPRHQWGSQSDLSPYLSLMLMLSSVFSELGVFLNFALSARSQQAQPRQPQQPLQSPAPGGGGGVSVSSLALWCYRSRPPGRWPGRPGRSRRRWWREGRRWGERRGGRCCPGPSPGSSYIRPQCSR